MRSLVPLLSVILAVITGCNDSQSRKQSEENLKAISLGLLNYESASHHLPARATFDNEGKPLLSWRAIIMPHVTESCCQHFRFDEPWDSEFNKPLVQPMPDAYQDPRIRMEEYATVYEAVVGPGLAFEGSEGINLLDVKDGSSKTVAVVEVAADRAVPWTKPVDWEPDEKDILKGLANVDGTFQAAFLDGHVETIARTIDPKVLKAILTRNGGERSDPAVIPRLP
jgi:prepilin-type processing-associated H-X9-DG protein